MDHLYEMYMILLGHVLKEMPVAHSTQAKGGGLVNKKADNVPEWYAEAE